MDEICQCIIIMIFYTKTKARKLIKSSNYVIIIEIKTQFKHECRISNMFVLVLSVKQKSLLNELK